MTRFVQITDLHVSHLRADDAGLRADTAAAVERAVAAINRLVPAPAFVVASGDLTNSGARESYDLLQELLAPLAMPVVLALGNHDRRAGFHAAFGTGRGDAPHYHDAVLGGMHVITLDTLQPNRVSGSIDAEQFAFLEAVLPRHSTLPKLIVSHHPPRLFDDELPWGTLDMPVTERLADMLRDHHVAGILSGHVHINSVRMWHGMPIYISQGLNSTVDLLERREMRIVEGTGFSVFDGRPPGLSVTFIPLTPEVRELGRIDVARLRAFR